MFSCKKLSKLCGNFKSKQIVDKLFALQDKPVKLVRLNDVIQDIKEDEKTCSQVKIMYDEINKLKTQIKELENDRNKYKSLYDNVESTITSLETQLSSANSQIERYKKENVKAKLELQELIDNFSTTKSKLDIAISELEKLKANKSEINILKRKLENCMYALEVKDNELSSYKKSTNTYSSTNAPRSNYQKIIDENLTLSTRLYNLETKYEELKGKLKLSSMKDSINKENQKPFTFTTLFRDQTSSIQNSANKLSSFAPRPTNDNVISNISYERIDYNKQPVYSRTNSPERVLRSPGQRTTRISITNEPNNIKTNESFTRDNVNQRYRSSTQDLSLLNIDPKDSSKGKVTRVMINGKEVFSVDKENRGINYIDKALNSDKENFNKPNVTQNKWNTVSNNSIESKILNLKRTIMDNNKDSAGSQGRLPIVIKQAFSTEKEPVKANLFSNDIQSFAESKGTFDEYTYY